MSNILNFDIISLRAAWIVIALYKIYPLKILNAPTSKSSDEVIDGFLWMILNAKLGPWEHKESSVEKFERGKNKCKELLTIKRNTK